MALTVAAAVALLMPARPAAQSAPKPVTVTSPVVQLPVHADTSPPLVSMAKQKIPRSARPPGRPKPLPGRLASLAREAEAEAPGGLQTQHGKAPMPSPLTNYDGISNIDGYYPPDTVGDVGSQYYVQWVNVSLAVFNKTTGAAVFGPVDGNSVWSGFGGVCENQNNGDPIVLYDQLADRWLISQFNWASDSGPFYECIAISTTDDPTGSWHRYAFLAHATKLNDYPKLGVWPDAYYMAANQFNGPSFSWGGVGVWAFERDKMLTGDPAARKVYFDLASNGEVWGGLLPSDLDGSTLPPAGAPNYFASVVDNVWGYASDQFQVFEFDVDWTTPANSTFTGPVTINLTAAGYPFDWNLCGYTPCVPQPGTSQGIDQLSDRLMHRLAYRNFGTHESLVVNHTIDVGSARAGVRWYEVRNPGGTPTLHQAGTYAPDDGLHRWMASAAMDAGGNMAMGFSVASGSKHPSISYVGRLAGDTLGTLPQSEVEIRAGAGSQTGSAGRWGDYSSMTLDPDDDCTFWYTTEYVQATGAVNWRTRIASFKFPSCAGPATGTLSGTVTDDDTGDPIAGALVEIGGQSDTTAADGTYSIASVPVGTYDVTASKAGYTSSTVNDVAITDGNTTTQDFALTPAPGPGTLTGTITNSATGLPVLGAVVTVDGMTRTTLANGVYTFADIAAGTYDVTVTKTGFFTKTVDDVVVASGATTTQNIAIDPVGTFKGKVNRKGAVGVAGATINAKQGGVTKHTTTSGPTGQYTLPVIAGTYDLEFSAPGYFTQTKAAQTVIAGRSKPVPVTLQRPGTFQGTVTERGTGTLIDGVLVELYKGGVLQTSMTTSAGGFSFPGLVPGMGYQLKFSKAGYVTRAYGRALPDGATVNVTAVLRPITM